MGESYAGKEICQVYGPADVSLMGVQYTSRLLNLHKIIDNRGVLYFPIPIAKRLLCGMTKNLAPSLGIGGKDFCDGVTILPSNDINTSNYVDTVTNE